jgi:multidrug efflux system membrane fusion protein
MQTRDRVAAIAGDATVILEALFGDFAPAGQPRRLRRLASLQIGVAVLFALAGCKHGQAEKPELPERPPAAVTAAPAITRDVPVYLDQIGKTVSMEVVSIIPQVGGKMTAVHVKDGADVKKGELLFEIDPRPFEAALAAAKATLQQTKAVLELARTEAARMQNAVAADAVSRLEYDQKKNAVAVAEARVAAAEAEVENAKLNLEYTKIYSPLDGRAGPRLIHEGNVVMTNGGPLLMIQQLDPIYAEFTVTENDLGTVRKFMAAKGLNPANASERRLKAQVDVPGDSARVLLALGEAAPATQPTTKRVGCPREGEVTFLDNAVQSETGTVKLRATVPNEDHYFWPGQFVNVRLVLTTKKDAVLVPAQAQQIGQQGPFVYVVTPQSTAEIRPIVAGQRQGDLVVVDKGVRPGENVIVTGQMSVMPNGKVMVTNGSPDHAPSGSMKDATAHAPLADAPDARARAQ